VKRDLLYWAIVFLVVALIAAFLGFGGVAGVATEGARMLFWVAIILVMLSFIGGYVETRLSIRKRVLIQRYRESASLTCGHYLHARGTLACPPRCVTVV
jgi:uncharacterized membrane protein YtjA (UPF0391 family)